MSAIPVHMGRAARFYAAPIGKKAIMALTGVVLFGYVLGHLIGNLQIFIPPVVNNGVETYQINNYAHFLHSMPNLLWAVRVLLIVMVVAHIVAAVQLWLLKRKARPVGYVKKDDIPSAYASRTMMWSGPIIAAFVVFHILHLTTGSTPYPFEEYQAYQNVVLGFRHPEVAGAYIFAIVLLCMHLYHGLWSMFHSVGWDNERYRPFLGNIAKVVAIFIAAGYISIPVAVLTGVIGKGVH